MKYLLDTNVCIEWLAGKNLRLRDKIVQCPNQDLAICSIVKAELLYGARKSQNRHKNETRLKDFFSQIQSLPFDDESAEQYGTLRAMLEQAGIVVGGNDLMIAAVAQQHRLAVVTRNEREFSRISTVKIEVW